MFDPLRDAPREPAEEVLGELQSEAAREVLADMRDELSRERARRALRALEEALEEDERFGQEERLLDPGLPQDYSVLGVLGRGASGVVYRAQQASLGREVAVKLLHPEGDRRQTERLLAEARRLAALVHPGIVSVHEVGRARSGIYVTLELQPGGSLQALLADGPLNPARAARLTRQAADALAYTHAHGVVHLDLKPGNVLLDSEGNARVADFGLARELAGMQLSATSGGLLGTPAFMAPEQAADRRDRIGERTDVYGLGALLYACLAGVPPFTKRSLLDTLRAVQSEEPESLERVAPGTPRDLIAIVSRAMAKAAGERYPTARALSQDLERFEAGEPVQARLPGRWRLLARLLRRHARELGIALTAALLALVSVLPFRDAEQQRDAAWAAAADELLDAGEYSAASLILARIPGSRELGARAGARLAQLEQRAAAGPDGPKLESGDARGRALGQGLALQRGDGAWLEDVLGPDFLPWRLRASQTLPQVERAWKTLLPALGAALPRLAPSDRERALALAAAAPMWSWDAGFEGWLAEPPADAAQLLEAAAQAVAPLATGVPFGLRVDVFLVSDAGSVAKIASHAASGRTGERVRFEGSGRSGLQVPRVVIGADILHLAPPGARAGDVRYEVEGVLQREARGVIWLVNDLETTLGISAQDGSCFLDRPADGAIAGGASVLEAHRYLWGEGQAATILMLAQVDELDPSASSSAAWMSQGRELEDWSELFARGLEQGRELPLDAAQRQALAPLPRARWLSQVIGAGLLPSPDGRRAADELAARLAAAALEPASLSDGFFARGMHTGVTTTGADCAFWLEAARRPAASVAAGVRASLGALPLPISASSGPGHEFDWRSWMFTLYLAVALALILCALSTRAGTPTRRALLCWALLFAAQGLDKSAPLALGAFAIDPLALGLMAWAAWLLVPWGGAWARAAGLCLGLALIQEVGLAFASLPAARLPLVVAFLCLAGIAARVDPWKKLTWMPLAATMLFVPAGLVSLAGLGSPELLRALSIASAFGALLVLLGLAIAATPQRHEAVEPAP